MPTGFHPCAGPRAAAVVRQRQHRPPLPLPGERHAGTTVCAARDSSPHSFDRHIARSPQWTVRPIVDNHGWDHESGIEGFSVDKAFMLRKKIPANVSGQITKDKKDANLTLETEASMKHSDKLVTTSGLDIQTVGKQLAYTVRSETRWKNKSNNKTTGGLSASLIGGTMAFGAKLEDRCDALSSLLRAALGFSRHPTGGRSGRAPSSWSAAARSPQRATLRTVRVVAAAVQACRALIPACLQAATARASCVSRATRPAPPAPPWAPRS